MKINLFILLTVLAIASCNKRDTRFSKVPAAVSNIDFNNIVIENDSINPIDMEFLYNGGGVAVGDFNKDGLPDLYFTASTVSNKLYLNKGKLSFEDITEAAGVNGSGAWCNAASVVDINADGLEDIYVCTTVKTDPSQRKNLLYVNQGVNKNGVPVFEERAAEYGLADTGYSVHAAFFDYDNDGDLDMYLVETKLAKRNAVSFSNNNISNDTTDIDRLFKNEWDSVLQHPVFTNVSRAAGIVHPGFGLGIGIADINKDGWKDIYVTNDFFGDDHLYINNRNGSFTNSVKAYFKHTSQNAMGNDISDINNDGLADIIAVDMNPEDNFRKKKNMGSNNYYVYQNMLAGNMMLQYVRNTLQLNMGFFPGPDSLAHPVFSDVSFYAGVAETDWSWTPSVADFDNDGNRDILITNGYPRDVTDHDFGAFRNQSKAQVSKKEIIEQIPQIKVANYALQNKGDLRFKNEAEDWGLDEPSFSTGAVYTDLDNDGDLDWVINNINEPAFVFENKTRQLSKDSSNFLTIQFEGDPVNRFGIGAIAAVFYGNGQKQVYENSPYRGYLSTVDSKAHFGLGNINIIDSILIQWPGNKLQKLQQVKANQLLLVRSSEAGTDNNTAVKNNAIRPLFKDVTTDAGINYTHREMGYIDFNTERLLPHKLSEYGPGLAAADIDGNGLDDIFIGGSGDFPGKFFLQEPGQKFTMKGLPQITVKDARRPENLGVLLFDADQDGDPDLYCASGSNEFGANSKNYQDQFFVNDGKGNFSFDTSAFPLNHTSKSCVKAADYDNDGDLDLFIGGRCLPGQYPQPVSSFIYRNDSRPGNTRFTDVTSSIAKSLQQAGMVCDALWTDFDNDGFMDLVLAGEWMPLTFLRNNRGQFNDITATTGIGNSFGWWNSLAASDFDNDGDIDYVAGNLGQNSFYRATDEYPVKIYAKDFDKNRSFDAITTVYLNGPAGKKEEYTAHNRDDIIEQLPPLKRKFLTYKSFGETDINGLFPAADLQSALQLKANNFQSSIIVNLGNGKFRMQALPVLAQLAPVYGIVTDDYNNDGNTDIVLCGNDYGTEVSNGRYDALNGLVLLGDGTGGFKPQTMIESGIYIPGNARSLVKLAGDNNNYLLFAAQNGGPLKAFRKQDSSKKLLKINGGVRTLIITLKDGRVRREEIYYGSSFLSQSSAFVYAGETLTKIESIDQHGNKKLLYRN